MGRRAIRLKAIDVAHHGHAAVVGAAIEFAVERDEGVQRLDAPDAIDQAIAVFVNRFAPAGLSAQPGDENERAPPTLRPLPVGVDVNHRLQLHVVEQDAAFVTRQRVKILPHPVLPDIDAPPRDFERAVRREHIGRLVPQPLVDIVAVGRLQIADRQMGFRDRRLPLQRADLVPQGIDRLAQRCDFIRHPNSPAGRLGDNLVAPHRNVRYDYCKNLDDFIETKERMGNDP